jgi:hypothetical protein
MPEAALHLQLLLPDLSAPGYARLAEVIPGLRATPIGLDIPLVDLGPEEALAVCLRFGVTCRGTRIVAEPGAG